jgi:hypothetical protein
MACHQEEPGQTNTIAQVTGYTPNYKYPSPPHLQRHHVPTTPKVRKLRKLRWPIPANADTADGRMVRPRQRKQQGLPHGAIAPPGERDAQSGKRQCRRGVSSTRQAERNVMECSRGPIQRLLAQFAPPPSVPLTSTAQSVASSPGKPQLNNSTPSRLSLIRQQQRNSP